MKGWITPEDCPTLASLLETIISPMIAGCPSPICFELECDPELPVEYSAERLVQCIQAIVADSIEEMAQGGDLLVTVVPPKTGDSTGSSFFEIEVADTGRPMSERPKTHPFDLAALGGKLIHQDCPQGGVAVTIQLPVVPAAAEEQHPKTQRRVA
ncbi:MAG: hypothetical protein AAF664_13165 [Planctomycetota bacterium]